ncbi:MAG: hypothetical protein AB8B61_04580 [Cyclobacteriaceae bacterium]
MKSSSSYGSILLFDAAQQPINHILYFDELGNRKETKDVVMRINKKEGADYVQLKSGLEIHLDHIYSVDNEISPNYGSDFFSCDCV